jgi:hypothetical protein
VSSRLPRPLGWLAAWARCPSKHTSPPTHSNTLLQSTSPSPPQVPLPYYHVLTVLLILDLLLISYAFVSLDFHPAITSCIYSVICLVFLGLKEVCMRTCPAPYLARV